MNGRPPGAWTFLTNHAHVLICVAADPGSRVRDVAALVGITERAVQRILADLEAEGYLERGRDGRRNHYDVKERQPLRHPIEQHRTAEDLVRLGKGAGGRRKTATTPPRPTEAPRRVRAAAARAR